MSGDNVELVRGAYEAFNRGRMGEFFDALDPDIEWKPESGGIDPTTRVGHEGVQRYFDTRFEVWDQLRQTPQELIADGDRVVAVVQAETRGRSSGVEVSERVVHLWTIRDGKVIRFQAFGGRDAAIRAARAGQRG